MIYYGYEQLINDNVIYSRIHADHPIKSNVKKNIFA